AELESLLDGDREAQQRYLAYLGLHAELQNGRSSSPNGIAGSAAAERSLWPVAALIGAIATLVIAVAIVWHNPDADEPAIARLIDLNGPIAWSEGGPGVIQHLKEKNIGEELPNGSIELFTTGAWAKIELQDGTALELSGHTKLSLGDRHLDLSKGDVSIEAKSPLRMTTPSAEIHVLGTQFNVTAHSSSTEVIVNEGLVRVKRLADGHLLEVPADHFVIAALERNTAFVAQPRKNFAESWQGRWPRDILMGDLTNDSIHAHAHLWRGEPDDPVPPRLLHSIVLDPSAKDLPPVLVSEGARLRFRGRLKREFPVNFGFTTYHARGGFSGKFSTMRKLTAGTFEVEIPVESYRRTRERFPDSSIGHEMHYLWIQTLREDAGLTIESAELVK
ncbi:MAG: FecR family protein, partial [Verrucomicrobiota bacterium]